MFVPKYVQEYDIVKKRVNASSKMNLEQEMALGSNADTKTDIISVVQTNDPEVKVGSHVYVIYTDNRPHLLAQKQN